MSDIKNQIIKFGKYKELLKQLIGRDLKVKYRRSVLGYLWSLLNPLLMMIVISAVFSYMFRFDIENYPIYLLTGQIFYQFFSESTNMAMGSIINNGALIKKVYVPKYIFPVSRVLSSFVTMLFSMVAILIVVIVMHVKLTWTILLTPLPLLFILCFSMGIGMIMAVLSVYFRDVVHLYGVVLTVWMYITPIFYPFSALPIEVQSVLKWNPLYQIITCFRTILLDGQLPTVENLMICSAWCVISLLSGFWLFKKKQSNFILYI